MSTNTGLAPARIMASTVAIKVCDEVITSSPGPTPNASRARCNAAVPDATPTAPFAPTAAANACSKSDASGPRIKLVLSITRLMAASISDLLAAYWALRSTRGIRIGSLSLTSNSLCTFRGQFADVFDNSRRVADDDFAIGHVANHDRTRADQRMTSNNHARQERHVGPNSCAGHQVRTFQGTDVVSGRIQIVREHRTRTDPSVVFQN